MTLLNYEMAGTLYRHWPEALNNDHKKLLHVLELHFRLSAC
jgi:hypothetical protein